MLTFGAGAGVSVAGSVGQAAGIASKVGEVGKVARVVKVVRVSKPIKKVAGVNRRIFKATDGEVINGFGESWYKPDGSLNFPPNNGAIRGTEELVDLQPGAKLGRFGRYSDESDFVSAPDSIADTLSLPPYTDISIYQEFTVIKPIPGVIKSKALPWGGAVGKGTQFKLPVPIQELLYDKYIKIDI